MNRFLNVFGVAVIAVGFAACNSSSPAAPAALTSDGTIEAGRPAVPGGGAKPGAMTIVGIVLQEDDEFDVLQAAGVRAKLVDTLNGSGQFTVFAPTDEAFIKSLNVANEEAAIAAVNNLPVDALTNILLYHVTEGRRISRSVLAAPQYQMLNGQVLTREALTAAGIGKTDISASNGVIHVINSVLIP